MEWLYLKTARLHNSANYKRKKKNEDARKNKPGISHQYKEDPAASWKWINLRGSVQPLSVIISTLRDNSFLLTNFSKAMQLYDSTLHNTV
jgi:hypothetical protein